MGKWYPNILNFQQLPSLQIVRRCDLKQFFVKVVNEEFGYNIVENFTCAFGLNEKRRIEKEQFKKFNLDSIVPFYPDALDCPCKRVLIKINSGPGQLKYEFMACL